MYHRCFHQKYMDYDAQFVKISMTHNKYLTRRLLEDNDPISAKSSAQISSLNLA